ncbi:MAG: universal stress protein [Candidatus Binatia bacterium]
MTENASNLSRILVATDLSPRAAKAIARAARLADEHRATLTIFHVLTDAAGDEARNRQIVLQVEKDLRAQVMELFPQHERTVSIQVATGTAFVEIIRRARDQEVDMIVVGAHGAQFIKDLLVGTTAEKVVRKGDRPVLVVKRPVHGPYRRVLVAMDFSEQSRKALELGLRLAPGAKFHLLHAYQGVEGQLWRVDFPKSDILRYRRETARRSREQMKDFIRRMGFDAKSMVRLLRYGRAPHVITRAARRLRPDLVCVGSAGRTGLPYILLGSVAEHVLREASCDVLVVRSGTLRFELP